MKPDWDKLAEQYANSATVAIYDVDCTSDGGKALCSKVGVNGYPSIKYYLKGKQKEYQGGRDFDGLKSFVEKTLNTNCVLTDLSSCSDKEKKYLEKMKEAGEEEQKKQLDRLKKMTGKSMKASLTKWLKARINILEQLSGGDKQEL